LAEDVDSLLEQLAEGIEQPSETFARGSPHYVTYKGATFMQHR
jgi:hypothetical protein